MSNVLNVSTNKVLAPNPLGFHQSLQLPCCLPPKLAYRVVTSQLVQYLRISYGVNTKMLFTDLSYSQPDYLDRDMYTNSCYPWTLHEYGRYLRNIITECIALSTVSCSLTHAVTIYLAWHIYTHTA